MSDSIRNTKKYAKSISQFEETSSVDNDDLFLIAKKTEDRYSTRNVKLSTIVDFSTNSVLSSVNNTWNMNDINVGKLKSDVDSILYGRDDNNTLEINGNIIFTDTIPTISASNAQLDDNSIITKSQAKDLITNSDSFIGKNSYIDCEPDNCNSAGTTTEDDELMIFKIQANGNDSSEFINDNGKKSGSVTCKKAGNLVVYGWLADRGSVLPQEAWVALCGKIKNGNNDTEGTWTILQVQPWNVSDRSHIIQYVGFNVPVSEGLELKIRCGFRVDDTASNTNIFNTLTFKNVQPNTFVGYIISNS